jgi:Peptidase_C39 like family
MKTTCELKKVITFSMITILFMIIISNAVNASYVNLSVPIYKQGDSRWSEDKLGTTSLTIKDYGCAITCIAMVFKYYGIQTDPKDLNIWLKQNDGYDSDGKVYWSKATGKSRGIIRYPGVYDYNNITADLNKINSELDSGSPVIAEVRLFGSEHYVVITGYSGSTYYINDPYYGTSSKLSDHYGSNPASAIYRILPYHVTLNAELISLIGDLYENGCDITGTLSLNVKELIFSGKITNFGIKGNLPIIGDWIGNFYEKIGFYGRFNG